MSTWGQGWLWESALRDHGGRPKENTRLRPSRALGELGRKNNTVGGRLPSRWHAWTSLTRALTCCSSTPSVPQQACTELRANARLSPNSRLLSTNYMPGPTLGTRAGRTEMERWGSTINKHLLLLGHMLPCDLQQAPRPPSLSFPISALTAHMLCSAKFRTFSLDTHEVLCSRDLRSAAPLHG